MLNKAKILQGYKLKCFDGDIGKVREFYFDDKHWAIRYLVADTGNWLTGRQVLISPYALGSASTETHELAVALTRTQIEESPGLSTDKPVSKQFEEAYFGYYDWPMYWGGPFMWGPYPAIPHDHREWRKRTGTEGTWDPSLRSTKAVTGYAVQATDGEIGHVDDFIIDDETWAIRYLVIDTGNWWPGRKVVVSTKWIEWVSWNDLSVTLDISRERIMHAPEYSDAKLVTRDYETRLHRHYDRLGYWDDVVVPFEPFPLK
jgi:uncharacterized protein YrrD